MTQPVRLVCLGEALIDMVAREPGPLATARHFVRAAGGAPANVAVGAARLRVKSGFVGQVGADPFGAHLIATLAAAGVDTSRVVEDTLHRTGVAFVSLMPGGQRDFLFYREASADQFLSPAALDEAYLTAASALHTGTLSLANGPAREATAHAVSLAGAAGLLRTLDVNLREDAFPTPAAARATALAALGNAEAAKLSDEEAEALTGRAPDAAAACLLKGALKLLVITRGAAGASYYLAGGPHGHVAGFEVAARDTTGAGDAFMAGLLAGLLDEPAALTEPEPLRHVLRRANACGALATTRLGAIPALPRKTQLNAFLRRHGG